MNFLKKLLLMVGVFALGYYFNPITKYLSTPDDTTKVEFQYVQNACQPEDDQCDCYKSWLNSPELSDPGNRELIAETAKCYEYQSFTVITAQDVMDACDDKACGICDCYQEWINHPGMDKRTNENLTIATGTCYQLRAQAPECGGVE